MNAKPLQILLTFAFLLTGVAPNLRAQSQTPFDLVITHGHIIDGTGSPWYSGDLGIRDGKIAAIGNLSSAPRKRTIDAAGKVVAPGFIDMLGQSELTILVDPRLPSKIFQGITSEITGEGNSVAPLNDTIIQSGRKGFDYYHITPDWRTFRQYFARLEKQGIGINVADYVGATQVRRIILGDDDKQPTPAELSQMQALVRDAMKDGAVGVSTALEYAPAPYAKTEELIALATEAGKFGGIYSTHMRDESNSVLEAIDEALRIGREAHIPSGDLAPQSRGQSQLGTHARSRRQNQRRPRRRRRRHRRHLRLHRLVQRFLRLHPALGARWRRPETYRAPERSRHPRAHPQRHAHPLQRLGQRMAGNSRPRSSHDRRSPEYKSCSPCKANVSQKLPSSGTKIPWTRSSIF